MGEKTSRNWKIMSFFLLLILIFFAVGFFASRNTSKEVHTEYYQEKVDSLQNKLDSLYLVEKEIDLQIDTVTVILEKTKIQYEKERNIILDNTPSADKEFFTDYINSNRERLYSDNNY